ncbi:hypothetical protein BCPG_02762, partial [Burkholderia cenocepacia PC184]
MKKSLAALGLSLMLLSSAAFAVPSLQQVEQSIAQRNWQQADTQLSQVIDAHPNNAHARYLYAQVLDREGRASDALAQLQRAKSLDPQLKFTDASRFAQTESRIRADAARVSGNPPSATQAGTLQPGLAPAVAPAEKHGPSTGMWIGLGLIVAVIALVLRWTLRRARTADNGRADDERRTQLKRATDVLNDIRPLKLDAKLSTAPGAAALTGELEAIESDARTLVETLSNGKNPVPPYRVDELEQRHASVKARRRKVAPTGPRSLLAPGGTAAVSVYAAREARSHDRRARPAVSATALPAATALSATAAARRDPARRRFRRRHGRAPDRRAARRSDVGRPRTRSRTRRDRRRRAPQAGSRPGLRPRPRRRFELERRQRRRRDGPRQQRRRLDRRQHL